MRACLLLLFGVSSTAAVADPLLDALAPHTALWPQAETTMQQAMAAAPGSGAGEFTGPYSRLYLAPDGTVSNVFGDGSLSPDGLRRAVIGRYRRDGNWIELELNDFAVDPSSVTDAVLAQLREWEQDEDGLEEDEYPTAGAATEPDDDEAAAAADSDQHDDEDAAAGFRNRLLRVHHAGGVLLIDANLLPYLVNAWDGNGPLKLHVSYWNRLAGAAGCDVDRSTLMLEDPLQAGLPHELARMLRREPVLVQATERLHDAGSLAWRRHEAEVRYRLDKGELHGLYEGMSLAGLPPHADQRATVVEVGPDHAVAAIGIERFHPDDAVELPPPTLSFTSRRPAAEGGCPLDYSIALRATVLSARPAPEALEYDDDGFAWLSIEIDQGAGEGLAAGDVMHHESRYDAGEGQVRSVGPGRATLLWRVHRYHEEAPPAAPVAGDALVTPAWKRYAFELFGDDAPSSPVATPRFDDAGA
jgi:hypothetical protein